MNGYQWSAKSFSERELDLQRVSDFHAVLLGMAAHDLRQPLQVIQSTYESAERQVRCRGRGGCGCSEASVRSPDLPSSSIGWPLRYASSEHTTTMKLSPVPLAPIFDGVRTENVEPARQKGLDLRVRPTRAVVVSNAVLLDGIVRNLVRNAIKYTDLGHVLLSCGRHGNDIRIDIYDTGIGMSADELPRIFEAFQRLDQAGPTAWASACSLSDGPSNCSVIASKLAPRSVAGFLHHLRCRPPAFPSRCVERTASAVAAVLSADGERLSVIYSFEFTRLNVDSRVAWLEFSRAPVNAFFFFFFF